MDIHADKKYADACVQTSPIVYATAIQSVLDVDIPLATLKEEYRVPASAGVGELLLQDGTLPSGDTGILSLVSSFPRTPLKPMKSSLPSARPSQFASLAMDSNLQRRIVSLPENLGIDVVKEDVARAILSGSRSVSMPAAYRHFATLDTSIEEGNVARNTPSFSTDCEEDSRIQVFLRSPGLPETPSPPSSPDSIEIIENSAHLPESFLHTKRKPTRDASDRHKETEWLTWSNSPPRPIPALHGPASLPYARCPSGAEGTVLEERSTAPGLIWGLTDETDNGESSRTQFPTIFGDNSHSRLSSDGMRQSGQKESAKTTRSRSLTVDAMPEEMERLQIKEGISRQVPLAHQDAAGLLERVGQLRQGDLRSDNLKQTLVARADDNNQAKSQYPVMHRSTTISTARSDPNVTTEVTMQGANSQVRSTNEQTRTHTGTLLDFLRGQQVSELNAAAPAFVPTVAMLESRNRTEQGYCVPSSELRGVAQNQRQFPRADSRFPSPTDSSSPVWSEPSPPLVDTPILNNLSMLPIGTPDLNLPAMAPMFGGASAFEQLKQLALYQKNLELLNCLRQALKSETSPTPVLNSPNLTYRLRTTTAPPAISRPCMPINLQDLVASQSPTFSPIIPSVTASPNVFLPISNSIAQVKSPNSGVASSVSYASSFPSPDSPDALRSSVCDTVHVYCGRRYPRSIPLARMLERRRLASVPEEASYTTSDSPNSPVMTHPAPEPTQATGGDTSTSGSADFDEGPPARSSSSPDGKTGRALQAPTQGDRPFKVKKAQAKMKTQDTYLFRKTALNTTEQENVEPKDRPAAQKKWKNKQGAGANKSKSKAFRPRRKED